MTSGVTICLGILTAIVVSEMVHTESRTQLYQLLKCSESLWSKSYDWCYCCFFLPGCAGTAFQHTHDPLEKDRK